MDLGRRGIRSLAVARTREEDGKWTMLGILTFLDPPRPDTKETIERAMEYGVDVKMITGALCPGSSSAGAGMWQLFLIAAGMVWLGCWDPCCVQQQAWFGWGAGVDLESLVMKKSQALVLDGIPPPTPVADRVCLPPPLPPHR
jgi:hypothetical protein